MRAGACPCASYVNDMTMVEPEYALLAAERDRAERQLNMVRALTVGALALAAAAYAPQLSRRVNIVNAGVIVPVAAWTILQYALLYSRETLPSWLSLANPFVDVAAITATIGGYGLEANPALGLKSPMVLTYMIVLAARPIASSARIAGAVAVLIVVAYGALDFVLIGHGALLTDPIAASTTGSISLLDEGTKIALLAMSGLIATYATWWHQNVAFHYAVESSERESLQARLVSSKLDSLKQQLRPHFLFNALNSIAAQIDSEPQAAQQTLSGLGALIRASLEVEGDQEVSLDDEVRLLSHYVAIQTVRFADRLSVRIDIEDAVRRALVPALILQPLVENAITHGIGKRSQPGNIVVRGRAVDGRLSLVVADDGPGLAGQPPDAIRERIGVGNARARLSYLYGAEQTLEIIAPPEGGFSVQMVIPLRLGEKDAVGNTAVADNDG